MRVRIPAVLAFLLTAAAPAGASADGVLEINQVCATRTGCFKGDVPGFPVTIDGSAGHSYRLTSDLVIPDVDTSGIEIAARDVGLDLAGFQIVGSDCVGATTNCTPTAGNGMGVETTSTSFGARVTNGSIIGMGAFGVDVGAGSTLSGLTARWNRLAGLAPSSNSLVIDNVAIENGTDGINPGVGSTIIGNITSGNGDDGIAANSDSTIRNNTARQNAGTGINVANGRATITGNTANNNGEDGIDAGSGSTVSNNTVYSNDDDGIQGFSDCLVQRNAIRDNGDRQLSLGSNSAYRENVINGEITVLGGLNMFGNSCNGATTCP